METWALGTAKLSRCADVAGSLPAVGLYGPPRMLPCIAVDQFWVSRSEDLEIWGGLSCLKVSAFGCRASGLLQPMLAESRARRCLGKITAGPSLRRVPEGIF